ncbi:thioredoxin domain-containing protein [bacterium]|nr:thioredoxin domain-containing protein [bacterium]
MENKEQPTFGKVRFFTILFLIIIGIIMCAELAYIFFKTNFLETYKPSFCAVSELIDCDGVAKTSYALSFGIPNALWGMILYAVMLMLLFVDKIQAKFKNTIFDVFKNPRSYISTLGIISFGISILLACISIFKIEKICVLCFCTYFINFFIAIAAKNEKGYYHDFKTTVVDFIDGAKNHFVLFLIVLIAFISTLYYLDSSLILSPLMKKERTQKEFFESPVNKYAVKGNILGKEKAKVVITLYSDYNCPYCRVANIMLHKAAREENILVKEVNFPLDVSCNKKIGGTLKGHEASCIYSQFALAAKKQGKFWGVANILFDKHPISFDHLVAECKMAKLGLDYEKLKLDANSPEIIKELQEEIELTHNKKVMATPSIEINGELHVGMLPYDELIIKIKEAQKKSRK